MPAKITPGARPYWYRRLPSPVARALGAWFDRAGTRVADGVRTHTSLRPLRGAPLALWRGSSGFLTLALALTAGARIARAQALAHPLRPIMAMPRLRAVAGAAGAAGAGGPGLCRLRAACP